MEECRWKLVRDRIGEEIAARGGQVDRARPEEARSLLLDKIVEEALELRESGDPEEAADLLEALTAWARSVGLSLEDIVLKAEEKRRARGGFDRMYKVRVCGDGFQS